MRSFKRGGRWYAIPIAVALVRHRGELAKPPEARRTARRFHRRKSVVRMKAKTVTIILVVDQETKRLVLEISALYEDGQMRMTRLPSRATFSVDLDGLYRYGEAADASTSG